jgi:hypothetical protein
LGHVGRPGAHSGIGIPAVAAWWLANARAVEGDTDAAAAPAKTVDRAMMRITVFIWSL